MILNGNNLILTVGGVPLAASKSCKVEINAKLIEVASPSDGQWEHNIAGRKSWSISADHLVQSLSRAAVSVGTTVGIRVEIRGTLGKGFQGFVDNAVVTPGTYTGGVAFVHGIFWDKTLKKFLLEVERTLGRITYYEAWSSPSNSTAYTSPSAYDLFHCDNIVYSWLDGDLKAERLTGSAIVKSWDVQGTCGNIMMGSFSFKGNGALTAASLPSTE